MQRVGRHSLYTDELADEIVAWIAEGGTLRGYCRRDGAPGWRTVYDWIEANPAFAARIARARDLGADAIAEEALAIADTPLEGVRTEEGENDKGAYSKKITEDMLGHRKLQVETRLKLLAKWNPKKYGDKPDDGGDAVQADEILAALEEAKKRRGGT